MTAAQAIEHLRQDLERYAASGKASPKAIAFRTSILNALIDSINDMERQHDALLKRCDAEARQHMECSERLNALRQWCQVQGVDLRDWDHLPSSWKTEHLSEAVRVAGVLRVVDGLHDACGTRFAKAYRNTNAFAYSVISSVAQEDQARATLRGLGLPEPPPDLPLLLWPVDPAGTTNLSTP